MQVELRVARIEDSEEIVEVLRTSRLAFLPFAPPVHTREEDLEWVRKRLLPTAVVTVAVYQQQVVGVIAHKEKDEVLWVDQLYVSPSYCGRGIGSKLLATVTDVATSPIRLFTFQQNTRGRAFYERAGFRAIEFSDGSTNEEKCPDVLYELGSSKREEI